MSLLSALKTTSFFEASFPFFRSELPWLFLGVDIHGIGISGRSVSGRGGGVECNRGPRQVLLGNRSCKALLAEELVNFLVPSFGCSGDDFHPTDSV